MGGDNRGEQGRHTKDPAHTVDAQSRSFLARRTVLGCVVGR